MGNQTPDNGKNKANKPGTAGKPAPKPVPVKVPPLFRPIDWIVMVVTFAVVWAIYLYTLAPELTLEDSGELCTGSFYAGIPHPPGYPFWAIYSWFWTAILPMGNVAWRVEVGESFGAAWGCAMLAFMVSRGSSMLIEGIEELKNLSARWEKVICMISGFVAGMMIGLDGFMWSESDVINRISLFGVPWLILVLLMLMRWMYAPQQKRYIYFAALFYGICATIHQTLLLSAMGIEVAIVLAQPRLGRDLFGLNSLVYVICLIALAKQSIPALNNMTTIEKELFHTVGIGSLLAAGWLILKTQKFGTEWKTILIGAALWILGVSFYFYEPIAGMTNPPMEWGYPRTVDGFFHALSRGQYEQANGTDILHDPLRFVHQLGYVALGLSESFSWVFMFVGLLPFLFFPKMQKRERGWIIGLTAIYFCLAVLLVILLNVGQDKSSMDLNKVFFTASHALFAIMIGYGMTLTAAYMVTHYDHFRRWGFLGGGIGVLLALYCLVDATAKLYFGPAGEISLSNVPHWIAQAFVKNQYGLPVFANLILVALPIIFLVALWIYRSRGPIVILLALFLAMPVYSGLSHWFKSEQRNHWFGYWFGHDMFTPPFGIYPEMARNAILFGGTDPGRFCPTYMIFCESFIPHKDQPKQDQHFDRRDVYIITQNALADGTYLEYIRAQYFRSAQIDPPFFREFVKYVLGIPFGENSSLVKGLANIAYDVLDVPFTKLGAKIEARRRAEGVYPPKEIYTPSDEDSQQCFNEYYSDVERREEHDREFPNEPKEIRPGEYVNIVGNKLQVTGQVAVMMINGLLCKVIFDHNPTNEFYVEESFPLDWMYPYETPFGIIMKINRNPLPSLPDDVFQKDHEFWSKYSARLIGNWITYDTSVQDIADFCDKTYLQRNFNGFKGDRKFIADDDGQKSFSKLRSSIAGIYAWRLGMLAGTPTPPEYLPKTEHERQQLVREADFAFKQAFAFCPYSPEVVYRYINFLLQFNRLDDALAVAKTCQKFDPDDDQINGLVSQLSGFKSHPQAAAPQVQTPNNVQQMEDELRTNPDNFQNIFGLAAAYWQTRQTNRVAELFNQALTNSHITPNDIRLIAQFYADTGNLTELETVLEKLAAMLPNQPEPWYDLAALKAILGKNADALKDLRTSIDLSNKRLENNPKASNMVDLARKDQRFDSIRSLPEFQKIISSN